LDFKKFIYDPIHGYIGLTEQELGIISTPIFQRLRYVKQLGTNFLVYPSATHSRFSHSLGAMHMMYRLSQRLNTLGMIGSDEIEALRLAALLHDVGHFPFSHCLEQPMQAACKDKKVSHEIFSVHLIEKSSISDKIVNHKPEEVSSMITKTCMNPIHSLLISSDLDADRLDYLLRDSHGTGVSYGFVDVDRLVNTLKIKDNHLAVEDKGRQALENYLLSRYHMYQVVYYHKTVVGFELMLQQVYAELLRQKKVYDFDTLCKLPEEDVVDFDDSYVLQKFKENRKEPGLIGELIYRFKNRQRLKRVKEIQAISISGHEKSEYSTIKLLFEKQSQKDLLVSKSGVPAEWIFFSQPKPLTILSASQDETAIHIIKENGDCKPIAEDEDSIISKLYRSS